MMPAIKTPRQRRALEALVKLGRVSTKELQRIAGCNNSAELMAQLWRHGWRWNCHEFTVLDRDGKKCRPGFYELISEHKQLAAEILNI